MKDNEQRWSEALIAEITGDQLAYESFLREFSASLRRIVETKLRRLRFSSEETEDIVQEVLIAVHTRRHRWDPGKPLMPWLNAIARYKLIDAVRRLRRDTYRRVDLSENDWERMFSEEAVNIVYNSNDAERLIFDLPRVEQAVVRSIALEGRSAKEAAARLGSSEGAVRVAFHRALKKLMATARRVS